MWSDEARAAALEARRRGAHGHNAGKGNRKVAKETKAQHKRGEGEGHKSVLLGSIKGAGAGAVIGGAIGAAALHQWGGARIGAKLGAVAGAKTGAAVGAVYRYAKNQGAKSKKK